MKACMKMMLMILSFVLVLPVWAQTLKLETEKGSIFVPESKGWELGKDMFGMPFIYFSPKSNGQRSNISFTATGIEVGENLFKLSQDNDSYKKMKNDWAAKIQAQTKSFVPYKKWANQQGHTVHQIGFEYLHKNKHYQEMSYYIQCREKLIYAKSLRLLENKAHQEDFNKFIKQLDCGV